MDILLCTLEDTSRFGAAFANTLRRTQLTALLLYGDLGAGKTTFTRSLVTALPGGAQAEVSSPSFTLCHMYNTNPVVHHFDLYRLAEGALVDELAESFDTPGVLTIVEWAERIHPQDAPEDGIRGTFTAGKEGREVSLAAIGNQGTFFLRELRSALSCNTHNLRKA